MIAECPDCGEPAPIARWVLTSSEGICPHCNSISPLAVITVTTW